MVFLAVLPQPLFAQTPLSLKQCLELALANQPALKAAEQNVNAGKGREIQARSPLFPQFTGSTGFSKSLSKGGALGESVTRSYTTTLSLDLLLYDFGRTGNALDAAKWGTRSSERELERTVQDVILNVKQAYYALLAARNMVEISQKRMEQTESHLKQAQAFFRAGSKPRFDVTRAEVDVNNARLGIVNARNNVRIQTIVLNNAMGIDPGQPTEIEPMPDSLFVPGSLEQSQTDALKNRPEMLKADSDIEAAKARLRTEQAGYFPTLSANGAYNWAAGTASMGQFQGDISNSWNAGIFLSVPLFQGGLTRGRVSEARANLLAAQVERDAVKQNVLLQVNQSYADMDSARVRIEVMESSLQKARESLALAEGRYQAGIGPSIEVTDAQLAAVQAEIDHIQAQYDFQLSVARLFKATGRTSD
jgi:TolC family type I secretion outer membrane protein